MLHYEIFVLRQKFAETENRLSFTISIYSPRPPQYFVRVISDSCLGSEYVMPISFRHLILPQNFPVASELLDFRPVAIETLQDNAPRSDGNVLECCH
jgi:pre-mRNA-splicing helicase BRR2|tara:strand:+ start:95 stop:385 length:291 start_codon:yes stop_codon:yes gene_type:complete